MIILMSGFVFLWITTLYVYNIFVDKRLNKILLGIKVNTLGNKDSRIDENNLDEIGNVANYINESFDNVQQNEKVLIGLIEDANSANKIKTEFIK